MRCLACTHFTFKEVGDASIANGFGNCTLDAKYVMYSAKKARQCAKHEALPAAEVDRRERWLNERRVLPTESEKHAGAQQVMEGRT